MMYKEFTELTRIHVDDATYAEIEKVYANDEGDFGKMNKQDFCKAYKANKNGIAEICAYRASTKQALKNAKTEQEIEALKKENEALKARIDNNTNLENQELKAKLEMALKNANTLTDWWGAEKERANKAEEELKAKDQEIMMLKAKLYDMMMKGVA